MSIGFIGGTGVYQLSGAGLEQSVIETRYGAVGAMVGTLHGRDVCFIARHGTAHDTPPHLVNYRANIAALKLLGCTTVVASAATGTLSAAHPPGSLAILTDFIDQISGRPRTFFDEDVLHLDYSEPYCPRARQTLLSAAGELGIAVNPAAVYVCTNGPRFETRAEIAAFRALGAELVGMTNVPEVVLAREAELCYAVIAIATNHACGVADHRLTHGEVDHMMRERTRDVARLFERFVQSWSDADCACRHALDEYRERRQEPGLAIPA